MGITGLYSELGPGSRISLAKFAADHFKVTGRRLRLAVDASIWSFQVQAGKGGTNPALRTLYYRLTRLLHLNITPLFVFDGKSRPAFKRHHKTHAHLTPALSKSTKAFLKLFGFPYHDAPGEAEAECAVLQQAGVVDAVLSEDVDTLMFGCGTTFRNWSGQGSGKQTPTHVTVYERETVGRESGLTPNGMILVALMSGGDYLPEGVPRCGIRIAADCARAGFGEDLCALEEGDEEGLREWRERLQFELETNESGWFKRKNKSIMIPHDFPDRTVLGYYTNPAVSERDVVEKLRRKIKWDGQVDLFRLRETVRHAFEWRGKQGAAKFVRTLAPALLARRLVDRDESGALETIVKGLHGKREHCSTDGLKEIRISFVPGEVIVVDMAAEEEDEVEEDSEKEDEDEGGEEGVRKVKDYDIFAIERVWVLDMYARISLGEIITEWEQPKAKGKKTNVVKSKKLPKEKAAEVSMLGYLNVSKPSNQNIIAAVEKPRAVGWGSEVGGWKDIRPAVVARASLDSIATSEESCGVFEPEEVPIRSRPVAARKPSRTKSTTDDAPAPKKKTAKLKTAAPKPAKRSTRHKQTESVQGSDGECLNSWKTAIRPSETIGVSPPQGRRFSALGIYGRALPGSDEEPCLPVDPPYELPEAQPPSPPLYSRVEAITIFSSPAPAAPSVSLPTTPSRRRNSSPLPEPSRSSTPSREHDSHTPKKVRTPPSASADLPPQTPTSVFKKLQIVDLLDDTPNEPESKVNRLLDFSPTRTPLSPNVTIRKNRRGRKIREPQAGFGSDSVPDLEAPIPFSLPFRSTSPLRKAVSITSTIKTDFLEESRDVVNGKTAKRIVLRESLEGRWEFIEDGWSVREGKKVWEELEVLDLTGED